MAAVKAGKAAFSRGDVRRRVSVAAGFSCFVLGGCLFLDAWDVTDEAGDSGPAFDHRVHVVDQALDCSFCHAPDVEGGEPVVPPLEFCLLCHAQLDDPEEGGEVKPYERTAAAFYDDTGARVRTSYARLDDEVIFSHAAHAEVESGDCLACHVGYDVSERPMPADALSMDECVACHGASGVDGACATCHSVIDEAWRPASHDVLWQRLHGEAFRARGEAVEERCETCHSESTCTSCHLEERPESHTEFFRLRGHAVPASLDRDSCAACHRDDACSACHESTAPLSHTGPMFGSPLNTHCIGCHFPLRASGCATCHKETPSHLAAPPQPPTHTPGANCRACHGMLAPLRHPDDGSDCNACHR